VTCGKAPQEYLSRYMFCSVSSLAQSSHLVWPWRQVLVALLGAEGLRADGSSVETHMLGLRCRQGGAQARKHAAIHWRARGIASGFCLKLMLMGRKATAKPRWCGVAIHVDGRWSVLMLRLEDWGPLVESEAVLALQSRPTRRTRGAIPPIVHITGERLGQAAPISGASSVLAMSQALFFNILLQDDNARVEGSSGVPPEDGATRRSRGEVLLCVDATGDRHR